MRWRLTAAVSMQAMVLTGFGGCVSATTARCLVYAQFCVLFISCSCCTQQGVQAPAWSCYLHTMCAFASWQADVAGHRLTSCLCFSCCQLLLLLQ